MNTAQGVRRQRRSIEDRRLKVSGYRLRGIQDQARIARELGVSRPTICRDFVALDEQYRATSLANTTIEKGRELERTEALIGAIWDQALEGAVGVIDRVIALMQFRAKLLGLEAPTQIDVTHYIRLMARVSGRDEGELIARCEEYLQEQRAKSGAGPVS